MGVVKVADGAITIDNDSRDNEESILKVDENFQIDSEENVNSKEPSPFYAQIPFD